MNMFKCERGTVSVFQCLILLVMLMMSGILVDASRIYVADRKTESALNAAARSVAASYNPDLTGEYGIFAIDIMSHPAKYRDEFIKYMNLNLKENSNFNYIDYYIVKNKENTYIEGFENLDNDNCFKEQVLDYIKYRAPATITENMVSRLNGTGLFRKLELSKKEKIVRKKRKELKKGINKVNQEIKEVKVCNIGDDIKKVKKIVTKLENIKKLTRSIKEPLNEYDKVKSDLEDYIKESKMNNSGTQMNNSDTSEFDGILNESERLNREVEKHKSRINHIVKEINQLHERINILRIRRKDMIREKEEIKADIADTQSDINTLILLQNEINIMKKRVADIKMKILSADEKDKSILENELAEMEIMVKERTILIENRSEIEVMKQELNKLIIQKNEVEHDINCIEERIEDVDKKIEEKFNDCKIMNLGEIETKEPENLKEEKPVDNGEKVQIECLRKNIMQKKGKFLNTISEEWHFEQENIISREKEIEMEDITVSYSERRAEKENDNLMKFVENLGNILECGLEKIYIVEYIMERFAYYTSQKGRGHFFHRSEVEYILWGEKTQIENIIKSVKNICFMRFALNTIDNFATSKNPHPVFRLLYSIGEGLIQACSDTCKLFGGQRIAVCPSVQSIKVNYPDHLRIYLLLQSISGEKSLLDSIRQLIYVNIRQSNPDFNLSRCSTLIHCAADVRINLWFLPLLHLDRVGIDNINNGEYVIRKETYIAY